MPTSLTIPVQRSRVPATIDLRFWMLMAIPIAMLAFALAAPPGCTEETLQEAASTQN